MKALIWIIAAVLALFWTGAAFITDALLGWLATAMGAGQVSGVVEVMAKWPVPAWLALWVEPSVIEAMKAIAVEMATFLDATLPGLSGLVGWLSPILWVLWAFGIGLLLLAAAIGHWLWNRWRGGKGGGTGMKPDLGANPFRA